MSTRACCSNIKLRFEYWPVIWLWPASLVLMQVTLTGIGDFSITVAVIACHLLQLHLVMFYWLRRPPDWQTAMALVILAPTFLILYLRGVSTFWFSVIMTAEILFMWPLVFRYSRIVWLHLDQLFDPRQPTPSDEVKSTQ